MTGEDVRKDKEANTIENREGKQPSKDHTETDTDHKEGVSIKSDFKSKPYVVARYTDNTVYTITPKTIKSLTNEIHDLRSSLQSWKRDRKAVISGESKSIHAIVIADRKFAIAPSSDKTLYISYRNSSELNSVIEKYQNEKEEKRRKSDSKSKEHDRSRR